MPFVPIDWLKEHVEVPADLTAEQLAADLVKVGLEEEEIHRSDVTGPIVVGKVLTLVKEEQKNGKLINYCRVDVGPYNDAPGEGKEPADFPSRGIICGAHNFVEGDYVVVSLPGAVLPGDFAIAARKTYGHISDGMICSAKELGLSEESEGIIVLAHEDDAGAIASIPAPGEDALGYLGLDSEVLEINVTPDRGYCFSMRGIAREYSHSTGAKFTDPAHDVDLPPFNNKGFPVEVADDAPIHGVPGADRFVTRIVRGVNPNAESPKWIRDRLTAAGMRPISLAVDATNYVMLDLGQPLHAYDLSKLSAPIVVRRAKPGEKLRTLDDAERTLDPEDLVISDSEGGKGTRVIGLAGVMGGASTEISDSTQDVLIEAAHFDAVSIARGARRHRLPSEASKRFERGVDPLIAPVAAQRVAEILVEFGGGTIDEANFEYNEVSLPTPTEFDTRETDRLTGLTPSVEKTITILREIGATVEVVEDRGDSALLSVTAPTWRPDLVGPAHYVEEVARLIGYDEIASIVPPAPAGRGLTVVQRQRRDLARAFAEQGWTQVLSYPFVSAAALDKQEIPQDDSRCRAIRLVNPLQEEAPYMRTSILDSLLATAKMNVARGNPQVAIFETSLVTLPGKIVDIENPGAGARPSDEVLQTLHGAIPAQPHHIAGVAAPQVTATVAGLPPQVWDWRDAIEALKIAARTVGVDVQIVAAQYAPFHPGRTAALVVGGQVIGHAGELAPKVVKAFDLPKRSIAFEFDADALMAARGGEPIQVAPVATYPSAKEDIALVVDEKYTVAEVMRVIEDAAGEVLEDIHLFDVYRGDQVDEGKKSLAFALRFRSADHTLSAEDTAGLRHKIVKRAKSKLGAQLRG
ncbi:phenylalanyl-tRNA synthetase beta chain [Arcanobacterium wilhelmae]|uniref:Phenylalanine--tRNA ligase beta subunit n=1 Tax=Arcanobacterium wilhelmae TaxID=1803177 RepID=A0ABT9NDE4_9ACTO|nr:phenylalanine--tRNA ligase subunit beta [Arcanobacterium wilhelmae]MDP9801743.1 phenylalanyl-tRNA synthetase beta chain [Arcanobacterium wilhelmae]